MSLIALARRGLQALHSSPHKFDKFEWSPRTRGTGEGAAAKGEGLYLAESPAVSGQGGQYWQQFTGHKSLPRNETEAAAILEQFQFDRAKAAAYAQKQADDWAEALELGKDKHPDIRQDPRYVAKMRDERAEQARLLRTGEHGPYTYEVDIRAKPEELLDWDKPVSAQSPFVQQTLRDLKVPEKPHVTGESAYYHLQGSPASPGGREGRVYATETLREAGIPGHRFLDQGSRGNAERIQTLENRIARDADTGVQHWVDELEKLKAQPLTRNYVIWEPGILDIMKRYAVPGAAPLAGLGALSQQGREPTPPLATMGGTY